MIYDKIKIYVTPRIAEILNKDAELFEFFKKDGISINKNALLTRLVVNYVDEFNQKQSQLFSSISSVLNDAHLSQSAIRQLSMQISRNVNAQAIPQDSKFATLVSLKPTKESQPIIDYVEQYALCGNSLSEYFRNMLFSYCSLPQDMREAIIFKTQRQALMQAIAQQRKVFLSVAHDTHNLMEVSPYKICVTKEEMHGYLLALNKGNPVPMRLSRIKSVTILQQPATFTDNQVAVFDKMERFGPQFIYTSYDKFIKVELTDRGVKMFKKMYVHRPTPCNVEGNVYTFNCSSDQVIGYFQRFGANAYVLSPKRVREKITNFYQSAYNLYKDRENFKGK